jgi:hypothetical protein
MEILNSPSSYSETTTHPDADDSASLNKFRSAPILQLEALTLWARATSRYSYYFFT